MRLFRRDPLDDVLFPWPDGSPFTVRNMLRSVECKGITGSGKSSGTLQHYLDRLAAHPRATITMITQKPEEKEQVIDIFARHGRKNDLIVIEEGGKYRCNFFEDELAAGADARAMTEFITILGQGLEAEGGGRDNDRFWRMLEQRIIYNAVSALALGGKVTAPNLLEFITTAAYGAMKDEQLAEFEKRFHYRTMMAAKAKQKNRIEAHDWEVIKAFWGTEFVQMDSKPRSSGLVGVLGCMHNACTGLAAEMTSTFTNASPALLDHGKSLLINFPYSIYGPTGRYIAGGWKYKTQKHILRRTWNPSSYFNVLVLDEFQESKTDFDPPYLSQCRSHGGCMLTLTQTVHAEYGQSSSRHKADMLLSNYGTHIYHLADPGTEEAASKLLGQRRERFITPSSPGNAETWDILHGRSQASVSVSEQYQPVLHPGFLQRKMRTGGPDNDYCVDAYVIRPGEKFRNGENYQFIAFKQRR